MLRLPVSGIVVSLGLPTGAEDILLLEAATLDIRTALALLRRVAHTIDGNPIDWPSLPVTDIDVLMLRLRQRVLGDVIRAEARCTSSACRSRIDICFSIEQYLEHHQPRRKCLETTADGWYKLAGAPFEFRAPSAADQIAIALERDPERALARRCIRPTDVRAPVRKRIEAAMEAIAPNLFAELQGVCPECGVAVSVDFDPLTYTLRELRARAVFVYDDVLTIAHKTHWSEADILALPTARRTRYAELVHDAGRA